MIFRSTAPVICLVSFGLISLGCASSSKRKTSDASSESTDDDVSEGASDGSDGEPGLNPFVGTLDCVVTPSGESVPEGVAPFPLVVTSTEVSAGQIRWESSHEQGEAASLFEMCPAVLAVDGETATLVPEGGCFIPYLTGVATVVEGGGIAASFETAGTQGNTTYAISCSPTTTAESNDIEGDWECEGTVAGGSGATSLTFTATLSRPSPDTVKVQGGKGIAGSIGFCGPVYVMSDETNGTLAEGQKCGIGAMGTPTGGTLTFESETRLSGTLAVDGNTFGTASFTCVR